MQLAFANRLTAVMTSLLLPPDGTAARGATPLSVLLFKPTISVSCFDAQECFLVVFSPSRGAFAQSFIFRAGRVFESRALVAETEVFLLKASRDMARSAVSPKVFSRT
jgi:hypothetical protein